jgi:hypothetical protein
VRLNWPHDSSGDSAAGEMSAPEGDVAGHCAHGAAEDPAGDHIGGVVHAGVDPAIADECRQSEERSRQHGKVAGDRGDETEG